MATKTMERTLLDLENRYWQALKDKDVQAALELTAEPSVLVGAQGVRRVDKPTFETMMRDATWEINDYKIGDDACVEMLGRNTAIVAYSVHEDAVVNGQPMSIDAAESSTWVRRDGRWVCALHTESMLGDAWGGDRQNGQTERTDLPG
jgi:hypothetical protein